MNKRTFSITRRDVLTMGGAVAGAALFPTFSNAKQPESKNVPMSSTALFYKPSTTILWDVWVYHHNGKFYLYYVTGGMMEWNGVGLAISDDGRSDQTGTISKGKLADIIAVKGDVLRYINLLQNVDMVMKDGILYKHNGQPVEANL